VNAAPTPAVLDGPEGGGASQAALGFSASSMSMTGMSSRMG
jgi:hypothetical protein